MSKNSWPAWLRALGPDDLTRRRLRREILDEARPLLAARRDSWIDAVSEWTAILSPIAAAVTLIFAGLALRQAGDGAAPETFATAPVLEELVHPQETVPPAFGRDSVPDLEVVMNVLFEPEGP